jgi:hypothetical protein
MGRQIGNFLQAFLPALRFVSFESQLKSGLGVAFTGTNSRHLSSQSFGFLRPEGQSLPSTRAQAEGSGLTLSAPLSLL